MNANRTAANGAPAIDPGAWQEDDETRLWLLGAYARRVLGSAVVIYPPAPVPGFIRI